MSSTVAGMSLVSNGLGRGPFQLGVFQFADANNFPCFQTRASVPTTDLLTVNGVAIRSSPLARSSVADRLPVQKPEIRLGPI
jgi:hypothetical protein